jgi:hypothetical protein
LALLIQGADGNNRNEALITCAETEIDAVDTEEGRDTNCDKLNHANIVVF